MKREELIREKVRLEIGREILNLAFLKNEMVEVSEYGKGIIVSQSPECTVVSFSGEEKSFETDGVETPLFIDATELSNNAEKIKVIDSRLAEEVAEIKIENLIKSLLDKWTIRPGMEEEYRKVAESLTKNPERGMDNERPILEELGVLLSSEEWERLPEFIFDVYEGRGVSLGNRRSVNEECSIIRPEVEREIKQERIKETERIIGLIIECEQRKATRRAALNRLNQKMQEDYLASREFVQSNIEQFEENDFETESFRFVSEWFGNHQAAGGHFPDKEQLQAISTCNKNVEVIARAGSGKTATILNRAQFLIEHCHVPPQSVLILAFNRKAKEELKDRMGEAIAKDDKKEMNMPIIKTFHALAYSIVPLNGRELLFDNDNVDEMTEFSQNDRNKRLSQAVQKDIIGDMIKDPAFRYRIKELMINNYKGLWERIIGGGYDLPADELYMMCKFTNRRTMRGEHVSCPEEKLIADILFEHGIDYNYSAEEKKFKLHLPGAVHFSFLRDYKENDLDYARKMAFFYFNSNQMKQGEDSVVAYVKNCFSRIGIQIEKRSDEEIWEDISTRAIDDFTKAVVNFINRCRKKNLTVNQLDSMIRNHKPIDPSEKMFLPIAKEAYRRYLDRLHAKNQIDFDGLLFEAAALIKEGRTSFGNGEVNLLELKHILIDEYQDFSFPFNNLISEIRNVAPKASLFCVGDDCQAINAFAGSELRFFHRFSELHPDTHIYHIRTNYRSVPEIVEVGNSVISSEGQGFKFGASSDGGNELSVRASRGEAGVVKVGYLNDFVPTATERTAYGNVSDTGIALLRIVKKLISEKKDVVILARTNKRKEEVNQTVLRNLSKEERKLVKCGCHPEKDGEAKEKQLSYTTHKYKGKQEEVVVLVDAVDSRYPLIHPTWGFQRVFGDTLRKIVEDERRLFYVAVTRAENELYILTKRGEVTPFLQDGINLLDWTSFINDDPHTADDIITIEITNHRTKGTIGIRGYLKNAGFLYNPGKEMWSLISNSAIIETTVLNSPWIKKADNIQVHVKYGKTGAQKTYIVLNGVISEKVN